MTLFFIPCGSAAVLQAGVARGTAPAGRQAYTEDRRAAAGALVHSFGAHHPGRGIHRGKIKTDGAPAAHGGRLMSIRARLADRMDSMDPVTFFEAAIILFEAAIVLTALAAAAVFMVEGAGIQAELS